MKVIPETRHVDPWFLSRVRVVFCVDHHCSFSFGHCVASPSSIYDSDYACGIFTLFLEIYILN